MAARFAFNVSFYFVFNYYLDCGKGKQAFSGWIQGQLHEKECVPVTTKMTKNLKVDKAVVENLLPLVD